MRLPLSLPNDVTLSGFKELTVSFNFCWIELFQDPIPRSRYLIWAMPGDVLAQGVGVDLAALAGG